MPFTRLPSRNLDKSSGLLRPACILPDRVDLDNPALDVMTDFRRLTAFIATPATASNRRKSACTAAR